MTGIGDSLVPCGGLVPEGHGEEPRWHTTCVLSLQQRLKRSYTVSSDKSYGLPGTQSDGLRINVLQSARTW